MQSFSFVGGQSSAEPQQGHFGLVNMHDQSPSTLVEVPDPIPSPPVTIRATSLDDPDAIVMDEDEDGY